VISSALTDKLDGNAESIRGLEAEGDLILVVTLDAPKPYFLAKLTYPTSFVVDAESRSNRTATNGSGNPTHRDLT
jgi:oligopeptide transport system substrate-binding protein